MGRRLIPIDSKCFGWRIEADLVQVKAASQSLADITEQSDLLEFLCMNLHAS